VKGSILSNRSAIDRSKADFYATPPDVTEALLDFLEQSGRLCRGDLIWEPACGDGRMADVMKDRKYRVIGTDLNPIDDAAPSVDFLKSCHAGRWIITNPPFSQAEAFIRRAIELQRPFAFLLKSQFWHAKSRLELFTEHKPAYVLPLTWRPDFLFGRKSGAPTMEVLWTVWDRCASGETHYIPLKKPDGGGSNEG
jgi:hypothetical protein